MNLILPVAGKSTRFPGLKPKWLLTHPNGNLMIIEAILGLNLNSINNIYLICTKEHYKQYNLQIALNEQFDSVGLREKLTVITLDRQTNSQPESVYLGIQHAKIKGQIYIKDSDNYFVENRLNGNFVSTYDLNHTETINAKNKSYVNIDEHNTITNIVEKRIISTIFNTGGYGFKSCEEFCNYYEILSKNTDLYISHIIYKMILEGHVFYNSSVKNYIDWGTLTDWNKFKSQFATLFVDIDGTLVKNSGQFLYPRWGETNKLEKNVKILNSLYDTGKVNIILVTSRSLKYKTITEQQLKRENIKYHQIIYGLYHAKRIIINDYAKSNPYRSCDSINLQRDSDELENILSNIML